MNRDEYRRAWWWEWKELKALRRKLASAERSFQRLQTEMENLGIKAPRSKPREPDPLDPEIPY
jgi:hypothetical protein